MLYRYAFVVLVVILSCIGTLTSFSLSFVPQLLSIMPVQNHNNDTSNKNKSHKDEVAVQWFESSAAKEAIDNLVRQVQRDAASTAVAQILEVTYLRKPTYYVHVLSMQRSRGTWSTSAVKSYLMENNM